MKSKLFTSKPLVSPALVIGLIGLVVALAVLYVATQGNFGKSDIRSQAARTCQERCEEITCRNNSDKVACVALCVPQCESWRASQTPTPTFIPGSFACNRCSVINGCERTKFRSMTSDCAVPIPGSTVTRTTDCSCPRITGGNNTRCTSACTSTSTPTPPPGGCGPANDTCDTLPYGRCSEVSGCTWGYKCYNKPDGNTYPCNPGIRPVIECKAASAFCDWKK